MGFTVFLRGALKLYSEDLVSYSVETNYVTWDTTFPAVTVCEPSDKERVQRFLTKNNIPSSMLKFLQEVAYWNVNYCRTCNNCKMNQTCVENYQELVPKIRSNCSEILTDCWWANKKFRCCDRFLPFETELGTCYSFNNILINNESAIVLNRAVGLLNLRLTATRPIQLRAHAPNDRITVSMDNILGRSTSFLPMISDFDAILKVEQTISDISVTTLSVALRGCLFKHEHPAFAQLWPFKEYSYNACVLYCRAMQQVELCNCTHFFMPQLKGVPVCEIPGLACLYNNKDNLVIVDCECPMACEETNYKLMHVFYFRHTNTTPTLLKRGTQARIRLGQLPSLRVRRQVFRDTMGIVGRYRPKVLITKLERIKIESMEKDDVCEKYLKKLCDRFGTREEEEERQIEEGWLRFKNIITTIKAKQRLDVTVTDDDVNAKIGTYKSYFEELFNCNESVPQVPSQVIQESYTGSQEEEISMDEVVKAIKGLKRGKAFGYDRVYYGEVSGKAPESVLYICESGEGL
ncbi:uncharacterized protein LOC113240392 [Hyposmocoma kahamanoa]|uniref:uncharacterized protein LOC113240392 n=1 Tax=Hyposmocoma kahamanoa TaxID=1477025 RepID=UPI000E6D84EA|nr:uncharacterized protein LOC113240392 [Hyposmocoma kahamanoa]